MGKLLRSPSEVEAVTPLDIIFSCHVCSATFSEVYDGHQETVQGLSDGVNPKDRLVTKLFLTQCCHVICSKHLENGAPPFHPDKTRPSAPCPVCIQEKGENQPRELFSIRGFRKGEYDEALAHYWFITPPVKLDMAGGEMEALRFQYVNLIRFSRSVATDYTQIKEALADTQNQLRTAQTLVTEDHKKVRTLEQENERLGAAEAELRKLKEQMPTIRHHLKLVPQLTEQIDQMRQQLATLGYDIRSEPLPYVNESTVPDDNGDMAMYFKDQPVRSPNRGISSRTAGRSVYTGNSEKDVVSPDLQLRPLKRQRVDSPRPDKNIHAPLPCSREVMPPPKKPLSRMKSVKNLLPAIRKKLSHGRSSPALNGGCMPEADVQMYDSDYWDTTNRPVVRSNKDNSWKRHGIREDTFYMTGALPVNRPSHSTASPLPQLHSSERGEQADVTFQKPSSVKQPVNQSNKHSTERSYIRLMGGLSRDTGLELGLQDPRCSSSSLQQSLPQNGQMHNTHRSPVRGRHTEEPKRWSFGHAYLHQSPQGALSSAYPHPDPLRSNPTDIGPRQPRDGSLMKPTTPVPQCFQQPAPRGESVVSPFFKSSNRSSQIFSRGGVAERENSSLHSDVYQYQKPRTMAVQTDWHEPRSLNGLSFFNSPRNTRNEPITHRPEPQSYRVPPRQQQLAYQSRNFNSRGFIKRPGNGQSPFLNDSPYGSSLNRPSYSPQTREQPTYSIPFPSFSRPSNSRPAPLPSSMPSIVSSHMSPVRTSQPQWNRLVSTGVRGSRNPSSRIQGNMCVSPSKNVFTSSGRRSVRR